VNSIALAENPFTKEFSKDNGKYVIHNFRYKRVLSNS
jgi:hypothetical protein